MTSDNFGPRFFPPRMQVVLLNGFLSTFATTATAWPLFAMKGAPLSPCLQIFSNQTIVFLLKNLHNKQFFPITDLLELQFDHYHHKML